MNIHPIIYYPSRWISIIVFTLIMSLLYAALMSNIYSISFIYTITDCITSAALIYLISYPVWYIMNFIRGVIVQSVTILTQTLLWLGGCFIINQIILSVDSYDYLSFINTVPIRLLIAPPIFISILLWYKSIEQKREDGKEIPEKDRSIVAEDEQEESVENAEETIDTVTVRSKNKIAIIKIEDIVYINACGDYVSIFTENNEYIKEQTMKYFQSHLPPNTFLRIHRSTIVNIMHISGLELYGKESYSLIMKSGKSLKVSLSGYKLLKERLNI